MIKEKSNQIKFTSLAADPMNPGRLYGGTMDNGLWISDDNGQTWRPAGSGISYERIMSVVVSPRKTKNNYHVVWVGTELSNLFRSEDGGQTWTEQPGLLDLPSRKHWRFPPRPETHHVSSIAPDNHDKNRIFVGIELGGVMKSEDQGKTFEDRKPGSQYDCHTLAVHPHVPGRVYEAAGGGYAESFDFGKTWQTVNDGLGSYNYLVDIAIDSGNENTMVASAATSPYSAYNASRADTILVRRENNKSWQAVYEGLPEQKNSTVFALMSHPSKSGVFYAINNLGFYISNSAGKTWKKVSIEWPEHLETERIRGYTMRVSEN